jgi:hypothetical protein
LSHFSLNFTGESINATPTNLPEPFALILQNITLPE